MPPGTFRLRSIMSNREMGLFSQSDWQRGVNIPFADAYAAEVFELIATGSPGGLS